VVLRGELNLIIKGFCQCLSEVFSCIFIGKFYQELTLIAYYEPAISFHDLGHIVGFNGPPAFCPSEKFLTPEGLRRRKVDIPEPAFPPYLSWSAEHGGHGIVINTAPAEESQANH
jgi:hypothetical protein